MARVRLTWPPNPVEELVTTFNVWEGYGLPTPVLVATVQAPANSVELDVESGHRYLWSVSAINLTGESPRSQGAQSPAIPSAPGAPTIEIISS